MSSCGFLKTVEVLLTGYAMCDFGGGERGADGEADGKYAQADACAFWQADSGVET